MASSQSSNDPVDSSFSIEQVTDRELERKTSVEEAYRHQQYTFSDASEAVKCRESTCSSDTTSFGIEIRNLEEWARRESKLIDENDVDRLDLISNSTSEHEVFYRVSDSRAVKRTWAGVYGQIPVVLNDNLDRRNATPSEYLARMALHIAVFGSDIKFEGVTVSSKPSLIIGQPVGEPSIVISQRYYEKDGVASNELIHDLLAEEGFRPIPASYFGWFRPSDGVVIVDAKPDNFIRTTAGLIPIDLQMSQFTKEQLLQAGLTGNVDSPIIFIPR